MYSGNILGLSEEKAESCFYSKWKGSEIMDNIFSWIPSETEDSNITFYNSDDGTPILIVEEDSYEFSSDGIKFDKDVSKIVNDVLELGLMDEEVTE
jgi:hypothetical protein